LTLVFDLGDFWIEVFEIARSLLVGNEIISTNFTLTKPGRFLSAITAVDAALPSGSADDIHAFGTNTDDSELVYGQAMTVIRMTRVNSAGANRTFGSRIMILMRK